MRITEVEVINIASNEIKINERELSLRMQMKFDEDLSISEEAVALVRNAAQCRACYAKYALNFTDVGCDFGIGEIKSNALLKNLEGSKSVYVIAFTAGIGVDRLIARESAKSAYRQFLTDAAASAFVDSFADLICGEIAKKEKIKPRFSPGFGGFGLEYQKGIISMLNAQKLIGLSVTENNILIPKKSITALIGADWR